MFNLQSSHARKENKLSRDRREDRRDEKNDDEKQQNRYESSGAERPAFSDELLSTQLHFFPHHNSHKFTVKMMMMMMMMKVEYVG